MDILKAIAAAKAGACIRRKAWLENEPEGLVFWDERNDMFRLNWPSRATLESELSYFYPESVMATDWEAC